MGGFRTSLFFLFTGLTAPLLSEDYRILDDSSLGLTFVMDDLSLDSSLSFYLLDGSKVFPDTDTTQYQRTVLNSLEVDGGYQFGSGNLIRYGSQIRGFYRSDYGKSSPRKVAREQWFAVKPRADFVFKTANSALAFLGVVYHYYSERERKAETVDFKSTWTYPATKQFQPYLGLVKKAAKFDGGFYYYLGVEQNRTMIKSNSADPTTVSEPDIVHEPSLVGLFLHWKGQGYRLFGEFQSVESGEGGVRNDAGKTVYEDYNKIRFDVILPEQIMGLSLIVGGSYKSLSYADNLNVAMESIPIRIFRTKIATTFDGISYHGQIVYGQGKDGQSIPEMNADYDLNVYGLGAGARVRF